MEEQTAAVNVPTQEFSNEEVSVAALRKPACRVELRVKATPSLVQSAKKSAVRAVSKEVSLPGFRKGRAPEEMVLRQFPQQVDKAWQEAIADAAFRSSIHLVQIPLLNPESKVSFQMQSHSQEGADLTLFFETQPTVPSVDPKELKLQPIERPLIDSTKVDEIVRQCRFFFAEWREITDRPAEEGDYLLLDVETVEDKPPQEIFKGTRFEVSQGKMAEWMRKAVLGLKRGDSVETTSLPDTDLPPEKSAEFQPKKVKITLKKIETAKLPEVDDIFAQKLGAPTVAAMRETIERMLNKQVDDHVRKEQHDQVNKFLLERYPFELPHSLIEKEMRFRLEQIGRDPQFVEQWKSLDAEERKKTIALIQSQSDKAVRLFYLCRKILLDANISISPADLPSPPTSALETLLQPNAAPFFQQSSDIGQAETYSRLILEKADDYIIENAGSMRPLA